MSTPKSKPSTVQTRQAILAVAHALGDLKYAVVGGGACAMLGSMRETEDVDFVVPMNGTKNARDRLKRNPIYFEVEKKTLHTSFKSDPKVEIEILTPPVLFKEEFTESTPTIIIKGVKILKPALILNAKCRSMLGRHTDAKKQTDADDILFLLEWCYQNQMLPTGTEVPNATKDFVLYFMSIHGNRKLWEDAGYDFHKGTFPH
ncbi:hypothetical protein JX265_010114 [Neoarthrinium moseri]|uniref:Uncharacterized protein n=1 Tax=Neoarthrinium moseri TaxID=1658444 RepID=A0A9Q0AKR5_9PEZI|nr:hypothetical protein JX265_010114 [Neoarthrinium moseri]